MSIKHLENLLLVVPDLKNRSILDIGSGKGGVLISGAMSGYNIKGIEVCREYINESLERAKKEGLEIDVIQSKGEQMPYDDGSFDFLNLSEVIEHVEDPDLLLKEMNRVLRNDGKVYISVPSRFSVYDTHYKILFINWLPRNIAQKLLNFFGKSKPRLLENGKQNLDDMYYATFRSFVKKAKEYGFESKDIRLIKIEKRYKSLKRYLAKVSYLFLRPFLFKTFHVLLIKP